MPQDLTITLSDEVIAALQKKDETLPPPYMDEIHQAARRAAEAVIDQEMTTDDEPAPTPEEDPLAYLDVEYVECVPGWQPGDTRPGAAYGLWPLTVAQVNAVAINERVARQQTRPDRDTGEFQAILEINDWPQNARWAVTSRSNLAPMLAAGGLSITTRGQYYPPGQEGDQPKLHLLVEGPTQRVVDAAVAELLARANRA